MANPEDIHIGDTVEIENEWGDPVEGVVTCDCAWGNEGEYIIEDGLGMGVYTCSADEITVIEP